MAHDKQDFILDDGRIVAAQAPVIISASRSTDIPAFYCEWFFHRLERGYSAWKNPFNGQQMYVSYARTRFIVFWSKNPAPLIGYLPQLAKRRIGCYVQYSLNDYEAEGLELHIPPLEKRIGCFQELAEKLSPEQVIWRFDPLILTETMGVEQLLEKVERIGDRLKGYTKKLVFSFADIASYSKVQNNLNRAHIRWVEWDEPRMHQFAQALAQLNASRWGYELGTCAERVDLSQYGIAHNRCVDDALIARLAYHDNALMEHLGLEIHEQGLFNSCPPDAIRLPGGRYAIRRTRNKDKGQRSLCGCVVSKDIGEYNTCPHECIYCCANTSRAQAAQRYQQHRKHPLSEYIVGQATPPEGDE